MRQDQHHNCFSFRGSPLLECHTNILVLPVVTSLLFLAIDSVSFQELLLAVEIKGFLLELLPPLCLLYTNYRLTVETETSKLESPCFVG